MIIQGPIAEDDVKVKVPSHSTKKEKSVLQAKLTKLAIQIGYGGFSKDMWIKSVYVYKIINIFIMWVVQSYFVYNSYYIFIFLSLIIIIIITIK